MVFADRNSVSPFATPRPKNFSEVRPTGHYWLTSLNVEGYGPPPLPTLGIEIINIHGLTTESRVANDGIVYHCPNISYFGGGTDAVLVRPKIYLPDELELLGAYFGSIGVTIQYSDKGNYFVDTLERFGGLDAVGAFIKARRTRRILDKFMSTRNAKDGSVIFLKNDQRAYLNFGAIRASLGDKRQGGGQSSGIWPATLADVADWTILSGRGMRDVWLIRARDDGQVAENARNQQHRGARQPG
jgi:hypothetical protein